MKKSSSKVKKSVKDNPCNLPRGKFNETLSIDELKQYISECEERYHASFKKDSCKEIMDSYYEWQKAKKRYYIAIGVCRPAEENPMDKLIDDWMNDSIDEWFNEDENDELNCDFNSFV